MLAGVELARRRPHLGALQGLGVWATPFISPSCPPTGLRALAGRPTRHSLGERGWWWGAWVPGCRAGRPMSGPPPLMLLVLLLSLLLRAARPLWRWRPGSLVSRGRLGSVDNCGGAGGW